MSVLSITLIDEAALAVGNPDYSRVTRADWRVFLNQSCRDIARKLRLVLHAATFDIEDGSEEYSLPADCVQVKGMRWNDNPDNVESWRVVREIFEDEFNRATDNTYASGDPTRYFVRVDTFHLYPRPQADVQGGGKIHYWGLPDDITDESSQNIPLMDVMRDVLRDRMVIYGFRRLRMFDAAAEAEKEWQSSLVSDRDRIEDRTADRRSKIRLRPGNTFGQR